MFEPRKIGSRGLEPEHHGASAFGPNKVPLSLTDKARELLNEEVDNVGEERYPDGSPVQGGFAISRATSKALQRYMLWCDALPAEEHRAEILTLKDPLQDMNISGPTEWASKWAMHLMFSSAAMISLLARASAGHKSKTATLQNETLEKMLESLDILETHFPSDPAKQLSELREVLKTSIEQNKGGIKNVEDAD